MKMKNSILYTIKLGGINEKIIDIKNLINSILSKTFYENYEIHIHYENNINNEIKQYVQKLNKNNILIYSYNKLSWFNWLNSSFEAAKNFDYVITLHSDCFFISDHFDKKIINEVKNIDNLGTFTLLDESYKLLFFYPQFRTGFFIDQISKRKFATDGEYHNQKDNWQIYNIRLQKLLNLTKLPSKLNSNLFNLFSKLKLNRMDFPKKKIKTHGIFTHLMGFKSKNLKFFSNITDLDVSHGLYADEDICSLSLKNNLVNVFLPNISFYHYRPGLGQTRSGNYISVDSKKVTKIFYNKWKFIPSEWLNVDHYSRQVNISETNEIIKKIEYIHGKNLTWSKNHYSYEWENLYI